MAAKTNEFCEALRHRIFDDAVAERGRHTQALEGHIEAGCEPCREWLSNERGYLKLTDALRSRIEETASAVSADEVEDALDRFWSRTPDALDGDRTPKVLHDVMKDAARPKTGPSGWFEVDDSLRAVAEDPIFDRWHWNEARTWRAWIIRPGGGRLSFKLEDADGEKLCRRKVRLVLSTAPDEPLEKTTSSNGYATFALPEGAGDDLHFTLSVPDSGTGSLEL